MKTSIQICQWCGREYSSSTSSHSRYCCNACRQHAKRDRSSQYTMAMDVGHTADTHVDVTSEDIAKAVVQVRGAQATFSAGERHAAASIRPLCGRLSHGIGELLDGEGL